MYFNGGMYLVPWKVSWCTKPLWWRLCNRKSHHTPSAIIVIIITIMISYSRFMLFYYVYLQVYFVFESKSTFTTFKWLFKVRALFQCVSSNLFRF